MDLRHLRYFVTTAEMGSASSAARKLYVSQPSLSRQLQDLEEGLGLRLFLRGHGRLRLSPAGQRFLPRARDLLLRAETLMQYAREISSERLDTVVIAAPVTTVSEIVAPFVATLGRGGPQPSIIECTMDDRIRDMLARADLCVTAQAPIQHVAQCYVATFPLSAYVPQDHPWASRKSIEFDELAGQPLVVPTRRSKSRRLFDAAVTSSGLPLRPAVETHNGRIAQALAAAGRGIAVVTDDPAFGLVSLDIYHSGKVLQVHLYGYWRATHAAGQGLEALCLRLRRFCLTQHGGKVLL